jgi:hypothetical protein
MRSVRLYGFFIVFSLLVAVYTMSHSSKFHVVDEVSLFAVTESLGQRGSVDTNAIAWTQWVNSPGEVLGAFGTDGQVYSKKGPAPAFLAAPWYLLLQTVARLDVPVGLLQGTLLWNGFITAFTALLLWATAGRLGYSDRTGAGLALLFGLATIAWPYANQFFGEPLSALGLLLCFYGGLVWLQRGRYWAAGVSGVGAGITLTTVTAHAPLILLLAVYAFGTPWAIWLRRRAAGAPQPDLAYWLRGVLAFAAPLLMGAALLLAYNAARFGSPFDTGYHFDEGEGFTTPLLTGLWGLLLSPYRGVFWFTPLFVASLAAWPAFILRHRAEAAVTGVMTLTLVFLYSLWWMWWAGFAWGPRFLVPLAPFWVLWLAPWVAELIAGVGSWLRRRRIDGRPAARMTLGAWLLVILTPLSVLVQISAVVVNWVNYEIKLRELYPTDWENPLAFGPPAQSLADFFNGPVVGQWKLIKQNFTANTDLAWLWADGNIQMLLLLVGGAVIVTLVGALAQWTYALSRPTSQQTDHALPGAPVRTLLPILPVLLVTVWLGEAGHNPHYGDAGRGYRAIIDDICRIADGDEAIVTVAPFAYQIPMNWLGTACAKPLPIYGYGPSSMEHPQAQLALEQVLRKHNRVWLVTGGLPANDPENTVERWLAATAYKANDAWYEDFRLVDYATPTQLAAAPVTPLNITLVGEGTSQITIAGARASSMSLAGRALPVEILYRLQDRNAFDLRWFVQLLRPEGHPAALLDTAPEDGYTMFSSLPANTDLVERAGLLLPDNLPPGRYELIAGLYNPALAGAPRLRTQDGGDFIHLGYVTVQ